MESLCKLVCYLLNKCHPSFCLFTLFSTNGFKRLCVCFSFKPDAFEQSLAASKKASNLRPTLPELRSWLPSASSSYSSSSRRSRWPSSWDGSCSRKKRTKSELPIKPQQRRQAKQKVWQPYKQKKGRKNRSQYNSR